MSIHFSHLTDIILETEVILQNIIFWSKAYFWALLMLVLFQIGVGLFFLRENRFWGWKRKNS